MILFVLIWVAVGVSIFIADTYSVLSTYDESISKWWMLHTLLVSIGWPLILLAIIACGLYTTIKMEI